MLDYPALAALTAVVEHQGFERAAQQLCISQSAVSQRIRQLESRLGQPVLVRSMPPVATEIGRQLVNHMQQVRQLEQDLLPAIPYDNNDTRMKVRLAVNADSLDSWLPEALMACESALLMDFDFVVDDQDIGLQRMKNGEVMACICASAQPVTGGKAMYLGQLRYRALVSPTFKQRHQCLIAQKDYAQLPCLIFNRHDQLQHRFLEAMNCDAPTHVHYCPSSHGFMQMIRVGLGLGLVPEVQALNMLNRGELIDLVDGYYQDVPLYWHYWQTESQALKAVRKTVQRVARSVLTISEGSGN